MSRSLHKLLWGWLRNNWKQFISHVCGCFKFSYLVRVCVLAMAKWLKDYLSFGSKRMPPQPPTPDYTESEILKAYRLQKSLDFEDPYEDSESRSRNDSVTTDTSLSAFGSPMKSSTSLDGKVVSPKHRLIKVDSQDLGKTKILLSSVSPEESLEPVSHLSFFSVKNNIAMCSA